MNKSHLSWLLLVGLLFLAPAAPALAGGLSAVINGKSIHVGAEQDWNEENYGLGLEYQFRSESVWKKQLMVNGFRDSNDEMSYMAGGGLHRTLFATERMRGFYIDAGINVFLMTRQDVNDNRPFPGAIPSMTFGNRHVGVNLTYLPKAAVEKIFDEAVVDDSLSGLFFLQFKFSVDQLLPRN